MYNVWGHFGSGKIKLRNAVVNDEFLPREHHQLSAAEHELLGFVEWNFSQGATETEINIDSQFTLIDFNWHIRSILGQFFSLKNMGRSLPLFGFIILFSWYIVYERISEIKLNDRKQDSQFKKYDLFNNRKQHNTQQGSYPWPLLYSYATTTAPSKVNSFKKKLRHGDIS